ncbi:MAG: purine-binding chemotaxis protein CheW [Kiritimatiellae bacterium]|nr:purine-binding chemotaxis protein CheW [Kiritimatiellia bacterium]
MPDHAVTAKQAAAGKLKPGKFLTFMLGEECYGLEIMKAQEIIGMMKVTRVPKTPAYVRGVINLRGKVIPVVDLRLAFGMTAKTDTEKTCIIVVQVGQDIGQVTLGLLVDEVSEVLDIAADQMDPPPQFGASVDTDFLVGLGKVGQKVILLLDMDRLLSAGQMESAAKAADQAQEVEQ